MKVKIAKIVGLALSGISLLVLIMSCSGIWTKSYDSRDAEVTRFVSKVRTQQGNPDSHYLLACYYQDRGKHREAIEEFRKVLFIDPNYAKAYSGLGVSYDLLGDFSKAAEHYNYALKLNPTADYVYNNLGYSYLLQGKVDEAIVALKKASDLNNRDRTFHNNLGLAYGEKGQYDLALAEFKLAGDEAEAHHKVAQIYFRKGLYDEAKNHYAIALKLNPSQTVVRTALRATDALAGIFEPTSRRVESKQLIVPAPPKELAREKHLNAANPPAQKPMLKEVSLSHNISGEYKEPIMTVEKTKKVSEARIIEPSSATRAHSFGPEKADSEPRIATLPSERKPGTVERMKKAEKIVDVSLEHRKDSITYSIVTDGKIGDYDVFRLGSPSRLVLDIWNIGNHYPKTGIWSNNPFIRVVRIGQYPDKTRLVFDSLNPQLPPYRIDRMDLKLLISFGNIPQSDEPKTGPEEKPSLPKEMIHISTKPAFDTSHNGKLTIEVSNGNGVNNMARMVGDYFREKGFRVTRLTNADYFDYVETKIFYQKEYQSAADQVAEQLPVFRRKEETEKFDRPDIKIKILIGKDLVPHKKSFENGRKS